MGAGMALTTQDSPMVAGALPAAADETTLRVVVLSQFRLPGRDDPQPDDVLDLPRGLAHELAMYGRVRILDQSNLPPVAPATKAAKEKAK